MISNDPLRKRRVTYSHVWWDNEFNEKELQEINSFCSSLNPQNATTINQTDLIEIEKIRKSKVSFFKKQNNNFWFFNKINEIIEKTNQDYYNFDLYGYETCQYTVYDSDFQGNYDWHLDIVIGEDFNDHMWSHSTRKLSLILLLSEPGKDFTGGEFQINLGKEENAIDIDMKKGMVIVFPSFIAHRVKPVLSGVRKSIVVWVEGPKFK